ncbi:conserved exported hypothetical protein [Sphingomonas sp. EC-HK361]|uniref:hypothetical protein n=1 Tax=Sphingomonas sp. EC-HK361 TaxID=2038397 RepID=UPI001253F22C|nr:hypothetical protein [Sphingomonas sp. EC-HK361]VVT15128.1 conserved exported hypothetical protein [Sphingomonas sp. EC-HK361]
MGPRLLLALALVGTVASFAVADHPAAAEAAPSAADRIINDPRVPALTAYGLALPPQVRSDKDVQFGKALRISLSGHPDFGRIGVISPTLKPVKKGDRIVIAFWARAEESPAGTPGRIGRVQLEATPKVRAIFEKPFELTADWKMYQLSGTADQDYAPGALNAALHLDVQKQVLGIGPVFILDYGQQGS